MPLHASTEPSKRRSQTEILTARSDGPFLFDIGGRVVFERITLDAFDRLYRQKEYA